MHATEVWFNSHLWRCAIVFLPSLDCTHVLKLHVVLLYMAWLQKGTQPSG
jgi:hypothetical protein